MFGGWFKSTSPKKHEAAAVKAEPVITAIPIEINDAVPWDVSGLEEGIKYVQKFGFACGFVRDSFQHVPAPFSVCGVLFSVLLQEIETAKNGQQVFKALCEEVRIFQTESLDPNFGFYVKITKLQELCAAYTGSSKKAESDARRLYEILESECRDLNQTIKELLDDCMKHRCTSYHSLGDKADASLAKLRRYKEKLKQTLADTHFMMDVNAKVDKEERLNNQARSSIKFKAFRDKWQAGWDSEVETGVFLRLMESVLSGTSDPRSADAFKSMVTLKCSTVVTCNDLNELTADLKLSPDQDPDHLSLEDVLQKMTALTLSHYQRINSVAMQELWRSNKFGESVNLRTFETALSVALKEISYDDEVADVGELGRWIEKSMGKELTIVDLNSICKNIPTMLPMGDVFFRMYVKNVRETPARDMEVFNRSSEMLTFIWTTREISADDDEVADAVIWVVEPGKQRFTTLESTTSFLTVLCEKAEVSQTCRVIDAGLRVEAGMRLVFDDGSIAKCSTKPLNFYHRFFPTGNAQGKVVTSTAEKVKTRGAKKCITINNSSAFALIAMWTKEMIPRGSDYMENFQYDVMPNSAVSFDQFESDMFLTLLRTKTDLKNYALVMFSKKVERGSTVELNFDVVCDEKLKLEPVDTFLLRFTKPKAEILSTPLPDVASTPPAPTPPAPTPPTPTPPTPTPPVPMMPVQRTLFPDTAYVPFAGPIGYINPPPTVAAGVDPSYCCPRCGEGYKYTAAGIKGTPKKNGEPRSTMVNCDCWSSAANSPTKPDPSYCCPRCGEGYKYTAAGIKGTPKKNGEPRSTMVNCDCW